MKKILMTCSVIALLFIVTSCTDPNGEELYDLKNTENTGGTGEFNPTEDPAPPTN